MTEHVFEIGDRGGEYIVDAPQELIMGHCKRLIDDLEKHDAQLNVHALVRSATSGHSTHHLFSHLVERILPSTAHDARLLQRMKSAPTAPAVSRPPALER